MENLPELYQRWVHPLYLWLLHGNFCGYLLAKELSVERTQMISDVRNCVKDVDQTVVKTLLSQPEWRARLTAGWYAGLRGWIEFRDELGALLVESRVCFACQGYSAALACFGDKISAEFLREYLNVWLPQTDKFYDQHWALPALVWVDHSLETQFAAEFLVPGGLWDRWAACNHAIESEFWLERQRRFDLTLASALATFR